MKNCSADISLGKSALVAGLGLLIMTIFYLSADIFVFRKLIVMKNATTTTLNIMANGMQFRSGICAIIIVLIWDLIVAWALYFFLKPVNKSLSLLAAWLRLVYAGMLGIALLNLVMVMILASGADYLAVFEPDQLHAQVLFFVNAFYDMWALGLIIFGLHLAFLGYLVFKADYTPKILGVLLLLAGFSYLLDNFGKFLFTNYGLNLATFIGWGEFIFMLWLLIKGAKIPDLIED